MFKILLEIQPGDLSKGWDVELKLFDDQSRLSANIPGKLPPTDICEKYEQWQSKYCAQVTSYIRRHTRGMKMLTDSSEVEYFSVQESGDDFKRELNEWLNQGNKGFSQFAIA